MARMLCLCFPHGYNERELLESIHRVNARLVPDNIDIVPPIVNSANGVVTAVFGPSPSMLIKGTSACVGSIVSQEDQWWRPGKSVPDGSYALFRSDAVSLELLTDIAGSRTVWYAKTENLFIASTSQRAIVCFLGGFQPNRSAFAWMLSAGTLGPGNSWDGRIRQLGPDARLRLDRSSWASEIRQGDVQFEPIRAPHNEHLERLSSRHRADIRLAES